jgi:hypothetical protein
MSAHLVKPTVRLHLTNVAGAGATQLLLSLLPALERDLSVTISRIELPDRGVLSDYRSCVGSPVVAVYRRILPNALSRVLECTLMARRFDGDTPLLVLGDLPLRCRGPQTLFVQTTNLISPSRNKISLKGLKYVLARTLFRLNLHRVRTFIVQTEVMKASLERSYPDVVGRVHVIAQPVPIWLLSSGLQRNGRVVQRPDQALRLIYPAAGYPHKNHALLSKLAQHQCWPVERLELTLDPINHPAPHLPWVICSGFLTPKAMTKAYANVDGLLFLSTEESYGFPLIEAMFVGIPIVCPNLPYAHALCGEQAYYFDPDSPESLNIALNKLATRLADGWWPDWREQLRSIPKDWETVARNMLDAVCGSEWRGVE